MFKIPHTAWLSTCYPVMWAYVTSLMDPNYNEYQFNTHWSGG